MIEFGVWLASEINKRGMTQTQLASLSSMSQQGISHLIVGRTQPSLNTCKAIAEALDLPPGDVLKAAGFFEQDQTIQTRLIESETQSIELLDIFDSLSQLDRDRLLKIAHILNDEK